MHTINNTINSPIKTEPQPKIYCNLDGLNTVINEIALDSLKELVVYLSMTGITCCFVATSTVPTTFLIAISFVALNTFVRAGIVIVERSELFEIPAYKKIELALLNSLPPLLFSLFDLATISPLVHESGHFLAAKILFQNPKPSIEIFPLIISGVTKLTPSPLSKIGGYLGNSHSDLILTAAGPFAAILLTLTNLGIAHYVKDSHPKLKSYLTSTAIVNVAGHAFYAISALWNNNLGHDFLKIWKIGGIHPVASAAAIIALPIIFQSGLMFFEKPKE